MKTMKKNFVLWLFAVGLLAACKPARKIIDESPIKAYDIDFNWGEGGAHGFMRLNR
jgi:hypothetical protein